MQTACRIVSTDLGYAGFVMRGPRLVRVVLPRPRESDAIRDLRAVAPDVRFHERLAPDFADALARYCAGERIEFDVECDLSDATPFHRRAWEACRSIGYGETASYKDLACAIGAPNAARAVGGAMGRNRCPIVIPCHRILASGGKLGGYSGSQGLPFKQRLLNMEQVACMQEARG